MKIIDSITAMQSQSIQWRRERRRIGLVPTMGALHEGHLSLIRRARDSADEVVVSIFVNPAQFGESEDFDSYPRDFQRDLELCRQEGAAAVFHPSAAEMYASDFSTWVIEENLSKPLCGCFRPGHFRGVLTVVVKLLNAVLPDFAVFGRKDAQQALVIERGVRDLNLPVELVVAPIVREKDGLAMSSRNAYLSADERRRALSIHRGLELAERTFFDGERDSHKLIRIVRDEIKAAGGQIQYVEVRDRDSLRSLSVVDRPALLAVAAFFGRTRLIDNCFLDC